MVISSAPTTMPSSPTLTESAKLSSSCPSIDPPPLHLAIFPSKRSKMAPKKGHQSANQAYCVLPVMRDRAEQKKDWAAQKAFMIVKASARRKLLREAERDGWSASKEV